MNPLYAVLNPNHKDGGRRPSPLSYRLCLFHRVMAAMRWRRFIAFADLDLVFCTSESGPLRRLLMRVGIILVSVLSPPGFERGRS